MVRPDVLSPRMIRITEDLEIDLCDLFETTRRVESCGKFICECRIVDKAVARPDLMAFS
jgi:hypothetical protein